MTMKIWTITAMMTMTRESSACLKEHSPTILRHTRLLNCGNTCCWDTTVENIYFGGNHSRLHNHVQRYSCIIQITVTVFAFLCFSKTFCRYGSSKVWSSFYCFTVMFRLCPFSQYFCEKRLIFKAYLKSWTFQRRTEVGNLSSTRMLSQIIMHRTILN